MTINVQEKPTSALIGLSENGWHAGKVLHLGFNCTHSEAYTDEEGDIVCPGCLEGAGMNDRDIDIILKHHDERN